MTLPYEMRITSDDPTMRCAQLTGSATYTEANDGAGNTANNVVISVASDGTVTTLGAGREHAGEHRDRRARQPELSLRRLVGERGSDRRLLRCRHLSCSRPAQIRTSSPCGSIGSTSGVDLDVYLFEGERVKRHRRDHHIGGQVGDEPRRVRYERGHAEHASTWVSVGAATTDTTTVGLAGNVRDYRLRRARSCKVPDRAYTGDRVGRSHP